MEIKYYGVKGANLGSGFDSPDYFISQIIEKGDKILTESKMHNFTGQMQHLSVYPYEKGVVYKIDNRDSSDNYNNNTEATIIVSGNNISFIVTGIDKTYNSDQNMQSLVEANKKVESDIINGLGKAYAADKVGNYQKSDNHNTDNHKSDNLKWVTYQENSDNPISSRRQKNAVSMTGRKAVVQYDRNKVLLNTFPSAALAEKITGVKASSICNCCKGRIKTAGGYIWKYNN